MLKLLIALMIVIIFISAGIIHSSRYKKRCRELSLILEAIEEIIVMIKFRSTPVSELISSFLQKDRYISSDFFLGLKNAYDNRKGYDKGIWSEALENRFYLKNEDKEAILTLGDIIGETDTDGQISMLTMVSETIGKNLECAKAEKAQKEKLILNMWLFIGLGLGVMII